MPIESEAAALQVRRVSKRFRLAEGLTLTEFLPAFLRGKGWADPFYALKNVSFSVERGETLGITGHNGSGKTTLLKIIAGVTAPSEGEVLVRGRVSPLIGLGAGFHADLTGRENVFLNASILGLRNAEIRKRFDEIVNFAGVWPFIDTPLKRYSSGMYLRLGFSVAVHARPQILLVDEALAVGDADFAEKCLEKMRSFQREGVTIILVSHSAALIREFCDRAILLEAGTLVADGRPADVLNLHAGSMISGLEV